MAPRTKRQHWCCQSQRPKHVTMAWLAGGVLYSIAYLVAGSLLRGSAQALVWLRISALLIPPLTGILVIARRRRDWTGCQWLFWATVALGLSMTTIGIVGWTIDEVLLSARDVVARVVHGLRAVRNHRAAVCAARPAAPRREGTADRQRRRRHRRHRGDDRLPVFALRGRDGPVAVDGSSAASAPRVAAGIPAVPGLCGTDRRHGGSARRDVGAHLSASGDRFARHVRDPDDQRPGNSAGAVLVGRRVRRDLDPAVCVFCVGRGRCTRFPRRGSGRWPGPR